MPSCASLWETEGTSRSASAGTEEAASVLIKRVWLHGTGLKVPLLGVTCTPLPRRLRAVSSSAPGETDREGQCSLTKFQEAGSPGTGRRH